jgi:predicted peptidase
MASTSSWAGKSITDDHPAAMTVVRAALAALLLHLLIANPTDARTETGFLDRTITSGTESRRYQVYVPRDDTPGRRWPVILFLHGAGESGDDGLAPTNIGLGPAIRRHPARWPAIVVFPQARVDQRWHRQNALDALAALDAAQKEFGTDPDRVYLTGLSSGGAGSWYLASRYPERFAGLLVACGRIVPAPMYNGKPIPDIDPVVPDSLADDRFGALAERLAPIPTWIFHGDADPIVPVDESRRLVAALRARKAPIRYTELPGVGHGSWDTAYDSVDAIQWLFAQRRGGR